MELITINSSVRASIYHISVPACIGMMENECVAKALTVLYDSDHTVMLIEKE